MATLEEARTAVDRTVEAVFAQVDVVRREVVSRVRATSGRPPRTSDLAPLEGLLRTMLVEHDTPPLAGIGFIAALGVLEDAPRRLEWVRRTPTGALVRLEPNLDPESFGYYDFTSAEWFWRPLSTGGRSVVGPFVDFAGTDEYVVTFTVPVQLDDQVLGVAGADVRPGELAEALMPELCALGPETALVNADGRVVVSTSPRWQVGALLRESAPLTALRCSAVPWSLLTRPPSGT